MWSLTRLRRFQIWSFDLKTFGILEKWSVVKRGGHLSTVVAKGGSTVLITAINSPNTFHTVERVSLPLQCGGLYPFGQMQGNLGSSSTHSPPFLQGFVKHTLFSGYNKNTKIRTLQELIRHEKDFTK